MVIEQRTDETQLNVSPSAPNTLPLAAFHATPAPRHLRGLAWTDSVDRFECPSLEATYTMPPLPRPPHSEYTLRNMKALAAHPDLFKIVTPVNVDALESILSTHPNRPLVKSVLDGFRFGFWPGSVGVEPDDSPPIDNYGSYDKDPDWVDSYRDSEMAAGRWSAGFASLDAAMVVSPLGLVERKRTSKLRLTTDQTASGLNDSIDRASARVRYDNLRDLGAHVRLMAKLHPGLPLVAFKSDVKGCFPCLPMHPLWQLKQVCKVHGLYHVVRTGLFGNRFLPYTWCTIGGLLAWAVVHVKGSAAQLHYMDDYFGIALASQMRHFARYPSRLWPEPQAALLELWDEVGIPHEEDKQDYSFVSLPIIGLDVNVLERSIRFPAESRAELIAEIENFTSKSIDRSPPLRRWQSLLGWCNWALNACPLARPGLASSYGKISGKTRSDQGVFLNEQVVEDLSWFANFLFTSSGVSIMTSDLWSDDEADYAMWCDASSKGLGFHDDSSGFYCILSDSEPDIIFNEALSVFAALAQTASRTPRPIKVLLFTDNMSSVEMFDSLRAADNKHSRNRILKAACVLLRDSGISLRVRHIPGEQNVLADALSRGNFARVRALAPYLRLFSFIQPVV